MEKQETMLTQAELIYLMGLVEISAHDGSRDIAKIAMQLLRKLERIEARRFKQHLDK